MTNTQYVKSGNKFHVASKNSLDVRDVLPPVTMTVKQDPMTGEYFLEMVGGFKLPKKLYGDTTKMTDRILQTFEDRPNQTGVMLSGEKGSGKTLQAEAVSVEGLNRGYPTLLINQPLYGEAFNAFIQQIEQPTIIIFDEFEKVYDRDDQDKLLTLLDGVYPSKKLFMITCNDRYRVNEHMRNRPGRIFYRLDYEGLEETFIREYCADNLQNLDHVESLVRLASIFDKFNFDILKAMVEEMNRYDESPQEVVKVLNSKPEFESNQTFDLKLYIGDNEIPSDTLDDEEWRGNPLRGGSFNIAYDSGVKDSDNDVDWQYARFHSNDVVKIDGGRFTFENADGERVVMSRRTTQAPTWYGAY